jgi:hypothetical protein
LTRGEERTCERAPHRWGNKKVICEPLVLLTFFLFSFSLSLAFFITVVMN